METSGGAEERDRADLLADDVEHLGDASAAGGAAAEDGVGDARDDAEGGRVGRRSGRVVLRRVDGLPADAFCRQQVGERASRDAPEPCTDDGTPRASREACEAGAKYGGEPLRVICRYSSILRVLVVL